MSDPTIGDMIAKHNELKDFVEKADETYATHMKPYKDGMRAIETTIGVMLQQQNMQNFSAEGAGTAYLKHGLSVKVDNRVDFLKFVVEQQQWNFLDAGVLKDPVKDWLDKNNGVPPPGIKVEPFVKCQIRRT